MKSITIHNLDDKLAESIEALAKKNDQSLNKTIKALLNKALDSADKPQKADLSQFFGAWTEEEAEEFNQAVKVFDQIDEEMWK